MMMVFRCCRCVGCCGRTTSVNGYEVSHEHDEDLEDGIVEGTTNGNWRRRWNGFLKVMNISRHRQDVDSMGYVFSLMLRLYAHKPVLHELEALYTYRPERFIYYVPEFVNFALHGAEGQTLDALECFLHDKSEHSLRFAQRLFWFIRAYSPSDVEGSLAEESAKRANIVCKRLETNGDIGVENDYFEIEMEQEEERSQHGKGYEPTVPLPRLAEGPPQVLGVSPFHWAISFFDECMNMGITLKSIPEIQRNKLLRATLDSLNKEYFPSNVVYLPVGAKACRIVGIVSKESFCFKTNERVPYMICFEVIDDPIEHDVIISDHRDELEDEEGGNNDPSNLGGRLRSKLSNWKSHLQRQLSSVSSSTSAMNPSMDKEIMMRNFSSSQLQPMQIESSSEASVSSNNNGMSDSESLGQWTPKVASQRGAGFSHFVFHKDFDFETQRQGARKKALAKLTSTEHFSDIELDSNASTTGGAAPGEGVGGRQYSSGMLSVESEDDEIDIDGMIAERKYKNGSGTHNQILEEEEEEGILPKDEVEGKGDTGIIFRERWSAKEKRIKTKHSHLSGWRLVPCIIKSGDDLRQEQFVSQLIGLFDTVFKEEGLDLWLHPYDILAVSPDSGIIEAVPDTISIDSLKKNDPNYINLKDFFTRFFGKPKSESFQRAQKNFAESLAAYCIVCYILQIKDRHNGNLLLDAEGHIVHIDWGYVFCQSPGNMNFERYPFKLTTEFVQVLGGPDSSIFRRFRSLCCKAFLAARKRREQFVLMVEMMMSGESENLLPCFQLGREQTILQLNQRFCVDKSRSDCVSFVNDLIDNSIGNWRSRWYDIYQRWTVGIAY